MKQLSLHHSALPTLILAMTLSACGGGGGGIASAPAPVQAAPPASPAPAPAAAPPANDTSVELLAIPASQELAVATSDDPIRIRYDALRNVYEVKAGNFDWSTVTDPPDPHNPQVNGPNRYFNIAGQTGSSYFSIGMHARSSNPDQRYQYSNLAVWQTENAPGGDWGNFVALGVATPESGVPLTGTASFAGYATGTADVPNDGWGVTKTTPVDGTVKLQFDLGAGTVAGSMTLASACDCNTIFSLGTVGFSNTVFARGSQTFSGMFATGAPGTNAFEGRFTGPAAEELIGSWAMPFLLTGSAHQAWGAWVAKRSN